MALLTDLVAELRALSPIPSMVGMRIYPLVDQGAQLPSIVYSTRAGARENFTRDAFGLRETFVQLDVYSSDYSELDALRSAIIEHFSGFIGNLNAGAMDGGTRVDRVEITTTRDLLEGTNPVVYRTLIELNILST